MTSCIAVERIPDVDLTPTSVTQKSKQRDLELYKMCDSKQLLGRLPEPRDLVRTGRESDKQQQCFTRAESCRFRKIDEKRVARIKACEDELIRDVTGQPVHTTSRRSPQY